jgi:transposase
MFGLVESEHLTSGRKEVLDGWGGFGGALFVFGGKRATLIKVLSWGGSGTALYAKQLERGRFIWP